jgi:hypothetical protein
MACGNLVEILWKKNPLSVENFLFLLPTAKSADISTDRPQDFHRTFLRHMILIFNKISGKNGEISTAEGPYFLYRIIFINNIMKK